MLKFQNFWMDILNLPNWDSKSLNSSNAISGYLG